MFVSSPYPWHYTLRWPFYFTWPSQRNHTGMQPIADSEALQKEENETLRLLFCGDIMTLNQDIIPILHPTLNQLISSADYFIGNCESVVGRHDLNKKAKYGFVFHMPQDYLESIIKQTGLPASQWLLSTANNHSGDIDQNALNETYKIFNMLGITALGEYHDNDLPLTVIEKKGLRIGFVAWTEWMNRDIFSSREPGVNRNQQIVMHNWHGIKKDLNLDFIFGLPHWEYEFQHFPRKQTRNLANKLINDLGIDFLIGAHTHTLQPMEKFSKGYCAYNLGNFVGQGRAWSVKLNTVLEIKLQTHSHNPLVSYQLHYFFQEHENNKINIIPLELAPSHKKNKLIKLINKLYLSKLGHIKYA